MDIKYLKGRYEQAISLNADVVKVDIEEFASLLKWIDDESSRRVDAIEHGYKCGRDEVLRRAIYALEQLKEG